MLDQNRNSKHSRATATAAVEPVQGRRGYSYERYRRKSKCIRCNPSGDSFQNATRWMLLASQFFGIMPLIGVGVSRKSRRQHPSFSWRSPSTIYCLLLVTMSAFETCLCVFQIFETGFFFGNFGALTFYLLALVVRALGLILAMHWPKVLHYWRSTEEIFLELPYTSPAAARSRRFSLAIRTNVTFGLFLFLTLGECGCARPGRSSQDCLTANECMIAFLCAIHSGALLLQLYPHERRPNGQGPVPLNQDDCGVVPAKPTEPLVSRCWLPALDGSVPHLVQYLLHVHQLGHSDYSHRIGVHYAVQSNHGSITTLRATRT